MDVPMEYVMKIEYGALGSCPNCDYELMSKPLTDQCECGEPLTLETALLYAWVRDFGVTLLPKLRRNFYFDLAIPIMYALRLRNIQRRGKDVCLLIGTDDDEESIHISLGNERRASAGRIILPRFFDDAEYFIKQVGVVLTQHVPDDFESWAADEQREITTSFCLLCGRMASGDECTHCIDEA
jgi:hypothetical protein